ncbi:MAG: murein biosynthesis integral membrane protein MurJ [Rhodospirillales bacterium]|nr:MAG: murein biosynthesis integral membrane protein MurJ [Rhodospirillales bacterium]
MILIRAIATIGGLTMVSRVFGFARDVLIAKVLGAGPVADAFFVAFKFPNLFRRLFAEGAFSAAFVPIFAGILEAEGKSRARLFAEQALSVLFWALLVLVAVMEIAMPAVMLVFAPGFADDPEKFDLTVVLARIAFPYLLLISLVSLLGGVLNSLGRFAAAAAAPILLNICMILAVLLLAPLTPTPGHALAWGVFGAGVVQLLWLYGMCVRAGMALRLPRPRITPEVKLLLRRALPVAIGAGVYQLNLLVDTVLASFLPSGSISYLFYADRVAQLPLGVIGVAVGTALLPLLSRQLRAGHTAAAHYNQNRAIEFACLLTLPAAAALLVIAEPIVSVLFQRGAFTAAEAQATAAALTAMAVGLPAFMLVKALTPGFFARGDTATPVKIAAAAMAINVICSVILMQFLLHVGIALAMGISAWVNATMLGVVLRRRGFLVIDARSKERLPRILFATTVMAGALWIAERALAGWLAGDELMRAVALALLVASGVLVFAVSAQASGAAGLSDLRGLMRGKDPA